MKQMSIFYANRHTRHDTLGCAVLCLLENSRFCCTPLLHSRHCCISLISAFMPHPQNRIIICCTSLLSLAVYIFDTCCSLCSCSPCHLEGRICKIWNLHSLRIYGFFTQQDTANGDASSSKLWTQKAHTAFAFICDNKCCSAADECVNCNCKTISLTLVSWWICERFW